MRNHKINIIETLINTIPHFIFWKNLELKFQGCNKIFANAVGLKEPEEIIGKSDYDFPWSKEESEKYRADDREVIITQKPGNRWLKYRWHKAQ